MSFYKSIKTCLKYILTCPQVVSHKIRGVDIPYSELVTFFRYFPFGKINHDLTISFYYRKRQIKFFFGELPPLIAAEFSRCDYDWLPVEERTVVDIGAASGDTPIIFALRNAKNVIGYELNKRYFEMASLNIKLNQLSNKITLHHCGIAASKIQALDDMLAAVMPVKDRNDVEAASFKTLDEVVCENNLDQDSVLKIDVDGYEYDIMRSARKSTLRTFSHITMEYHFGIQDIEAILVGAGFSVEKKAISEIYAPSQAKNLQNLEVGMIYATRQKEWSQ